MTVKEFDDKFAGIIARHLEEKSWYVKKISERGMFGVLACIYNGQEWNIRLDFNEMFDQFEYNGKTRYKGLNALALEKLSESATWWEKIQPILNGDVDRV